MENRKSLDEITADDGRYNLQAIRFVYEGLGQTIKKTSEEPDHVAGQSLCEGLKTLAFEKWGLLAKLVLNTWAIKTTRDFGEIVYLLVENKWMSTQPTDSIDDFNDVYDFQVAFKDQFQF